MKLEGLNDSVISAFAYSYAELVGTILNSYFRFRLTFGFSFRWGSSGNIDESSISAVASLPDLDEIKNTITSDPSLLQVEAMI